VWWCTAVIPAPRRPRQEDYKFEDIPNYVTKLCQKGKGKYIENNFSLFKVSVTEIFSFVVCQSKI
jgi:hypothetical protein